jgi:hypothetical protein
LRLHLGPLKGFPCVLKILFQHIHFILEKCGHLFFSCELFLQCPFFHSRWFCWVCQLQTNIFKKMLQLSLGRTLETTCAIFLWAETVGEIPKTPKLIFHKKEQGGKDFGDNLCTFFSTNCGGDNLCTG